MKRLKHCLFFAALLLLALHPRASAQSSQLLGNPGFENGSGNPAPWVASPNVIDSSGVEAAHGGSWKAWLDGFGTTHTDTLYQQVTIPSTTTTATLSFWLHIDTAETTTTTAYDKLQVQIRNTSGTVLTTLATYSNLNAASGYSQKTFDVSAYQGQTLQVFLTGSEDSTLQTSFVVDDFALNIAIPPATPTNLMATAGNSLISLSWNASANATSYNVKRSTTSGGGYTTIATGETGTTYTDTGVNNGTTYYYVVNAVNSVGISGNSNVASATPQRPVLCVQHQYYNQIVAQYPEVAVRQAEIDTFTRYYERFHEALDAGAQTGIVYIPVVVHVVYNTAAENISDAQVQSQIDELNRDYRAANTGLDTVPSAFAPLIADTRIQFKLATRDPNCQATSGILHVHTDNASFGDGLQNFEHLDKVKSSGMGGDDAWPRDKYLNLWSCNFTNGGLLGYAAFPSGPANVDGVVISYDTFGTIGSLRAQYNQGRVAAHEVGHWLNLHHIWGDDVCGDDLVADTPVQMGPNFDCLTFPSVSCNNGPNGDMFYDYMDYTPDSCKVMFTQGQSVRMQACLAGPRSSILSSDGLLPGLNIPPPPDIWIADTPEDIGDEPNTLSQRFYVSDDIWVRNQDDGFVNAEHQNPVYLPDDFNYVYVRVRNRGCTGPASGTVKLYWGFASTGLAWPVPFDGSASVVDSSGNTIVLGGQIGSLPSGSIPMRSSVVLQFPWSPPNPLDYTFLGGDNTHFCLVARVETSDTAPYGMTFPEGNDLGVNVANNNNIAWKNVNVVPPGGGGTRMSFVTVANFTSAAKTTKIEFSVPRPGGADSIFAWGTVLVDLGTTLHAKWVAAGKHGAGITDVGNGHTIQIAPYNSGSAPYIGNITFAAGDVFPISARFVPAQPIHNNRVYLFNVNQFTQNAQGDTFVGGQQFVVKDILQTAPVTPTTVLTNLALDGYSGNPVSAPALLEVRDPNHYTFVNGQFSQNFLLPVNTPSSFKTSLTSASDTYLLRVKSATSLRSDLPDALLNGTLNLSFNLLNGDANGDNIIDISDFSILVNAYGSAVNDGTGSYNPRVDFNGDGVINIGDFGILVNNYGVSGDP